MDEVAIHTSIQNSPGKSAHAIHVSIQSVLDQEDLITLAMVSQVNTIIPFLVGGHRGRFLILFGDNCSTILRMHVGPDQ